MTLDCTCNRLTEAERKAALWDGIVRCGECVYGRDRRLDGKAVAPGGVFCAVVKLTWEPDFFCRLGQRKEDA